MAGGYEVLVKCDLLVAETAGVRHMLHTKPRYLFCFISQEEI